ncbi:hypothetical protein KM620_gp134 [Hyposidra talaca nucleopolyhedrovirus]|uniref:Uncharacterized protein n=1 Tax=Hyposidra talaca nucleopolyhedrovirus TaxID=1070315 RepID=A0A2Z4HI90_9ABAC|nr:hypothetical protein KM620_gp134 [Hyposidra talaca nucleopolyhedrovirus]AWW14494.1 hypothetical protein HytaNPV_gp134 [Hyposidra talaca nucleopolyhedrovirus]
MNIKLNSIRRGPVSHSTGAHKPALDWRSIRLSVFITLLAFKSIILAIRLVS